MIPFSDQIADRAQRVAREVAGSLAAEHTAMNLAITLLGLLIIDGCLRGLDLPATLDGLLVERVPASSWGRAARTGLYALPYLTISNAFSDLRALSPRFQSEFRIAI
jgi:hypothetical protein